MKTNENYIEEKLYELTKALMDNNEFNYLYTNDKSTLLHIISSDSKQAINFVNLIEDEFEIDFDDDEIDFEFFSNFDKIVELIKYH